MKPITIPHISIPTIGIPTIGIPSVGFPSASGGGGLSWPAGMKEHIKAWYDPKKQGMTNFDVIESYAEDFTASKWVTVQDRAVFTKTASKIHITESMSDGFNTTFIETSQSRYGNEMKINVSGIVAGGVTLKYRYGSYEEVVDITSNGVYTLPAGKAGTNPNGYNGFVMKAKGKCDITITQLPTSILKDFSGNGNHAYLYGGKGKLNSGMGVYKFDFLSDLRINSAYIPYSDRQEDKICSLIEHPAGWLFQFVSLSDIPAFKVEVKGIVNDRFVYRYYDENGNRGKEIIINKDGIYELPISYSVENNTGVGIVCSDACVDNVCFTQIPDYPDQLCYDGKMYAVAYDMPILTDYTVMAERTWFESGPYCAFISNRDDDIPENKRGAFVFEQLNGGVQGTSSFGSIPSINFVSEKISWQTKESYNGKSIGFGSNISSNPVIVVGAGVYYTNTNKVASYANLCHGTIIIADRSFTEEEINWLKQNWDKI